MYTCNFNRGSLAVQFRYWDEKRYSLYVGFEVLDEGNDNDRFAWRSILPQVKGGYGTLIDGVEDVDSIQDLLIAFVEFCNEIDSILDADLARYDDAIRMVMALDPGLSGIMRQSAGYTAEKSVYEMATLNTLWERCLLAASTGPENAVKGKGGRL